MTPTIILCILVVQLLVGGIGLVVWRRGSHHRSSSTSSSCAVSPQGKADTKRCQVLLGNIGQLLNSHGQLLNFLCSDSVEMDQAESMGKLRPKKNIRYGQVLGDRVDELGDLLESYDDLYLHERLKLKDYSSRAEDLDDLIKQVESQAGEAGQLLSQMMRAMLVENQELRKTVEGCRTRISDLIVVAMKSGRDVRVDSLTKLPNRRAWGERVQLIGADERLAVAIFDIDSFKSLNDTHGHAAGDAVLRLVARMLSEEARALAFRNGGDEFYILLDVKTADEAHRCMESIRSRVERASVLFDGTRLSTTVTGGGAVRGANESLATVLAFADKSLYLAKEAGRNKVKVHAAQSQA